jgi:hypothetical protein
MPQFDIFIYLTIFLIFLSFTIIIYIIVSMSLVPFFWNIFYFRFLKKSYNKFFEHIYLNCKDESFIAFINVLRKHNELLVYGKINKINKGLYAFKIYCLKTIRLFKFFK